MKNFIAKSKKLCAVVLMAAMVFGVTLTAPKAVRAESKYWIKVNKQANVATVYQLKGGKYVAVKAMLVSCGGSNTPSGTYYTPAKYRWHTLMGPSYGQYCTRINGGVLFHSVWYYSHSKASQATKEFNKLGQTASHGCVRLSVADAKWIYDNCALGTKVTVYSSSNPGPLGKPKGIKVSTARKMYWDPTDPDKNNPYNKQKPSISISKKKAKTVQYGTAYSIKSKVTAKQANKVSLTKKIKYTVAKYNSKKKKYVKAKFSTKSLGTYKITYTVKSVGGTTASKTFKVKVVDTKAPVISAKNRTVTIGKTYPSNAAYGVTAKQRSGANRISVMDVYIKAPGASKYIKYSYAKAKAYQFNKAGTYKIQYQVKSKYKPYTKAAKTITVTAKYANAALNTQKTLMSYAQNTTLTDDQLKQDFGVSAYDYNGKINLTSKVSVDKTKLDTTKPGEYAVTFSIAGANKTVMKKTVTVKIEAAATTATSEATTATSEATTAVKSK